MINAKQQVSLQTHSHIDDPDVILIGSGIMSATLAAMVKRLQPELKIQLYEVTNEIAQESSEGWNNAGTGHAGICELSYTPDRESDGSVDVTKAIEIFQQFEQSKQFWAYALREGMIDGPRDFINQVPHISFVYGQEQVEFLKARYAGMSAHHFFREMEFSIDPEEIKRWAPLLIAGRPDMPVAATRMAAGTDVNYGTLARKLVRWLGQQPGCGVATQHRVVDLDRTSAGWNVTVQDIARNRRIKNQASFVFIGAGGGSLPLLQKSDIVEAKDYGGFPVGGQWLVCEKSEVVARHQAKVYGQAQAEAPTMAVPHLDKRVIDGKQSLLFGPFAAFTTKFLLRSGSRWDLPLTVRFSNIGSLAKVGLYNLPLVKYLIQQGTQSMAARMKVLRDFYPEARREDWRLVEAGIRVQAIKKEDGAAGIVHYGTEVVTDADKSIAALLGASPGASVSVSIMLEVLTNCLPHLLETEHSKSIMKQMIPTYHENLVPDSMADRFGQVRQASDVLLQLTDTGASKKVRSSIKVNRGFSTMKEKRNMNVKLIEQSPLVLGAGELWRKGTTADFLSAIGAGNLPSESFHRWLVQDYAFAKGLASFQAVAIAKTPRPAQKVLIAGLFALDGELDWFEQKAHEHQLDLNAVNHPTCRRYVDYLIAAAYTQPYEVLLPILYGVEAAYLSAWSSLEPSGPYAEYIQRWSNPLFAEYVTELLGICDREPDEIQQRQFNEVLRHEQDFWCMTWEG